MKRQQLNNIFEKDIKRINKIEKKVSIIILIFALSLSFAILYIDQNKVQYVEYSEHGNIDYKVYLKENDFFDNNYLEQNNQYISTLINNIEAKFKYNVLLEEEKVTYKYNYKIIANVKVTDKTTKRNLYNKAEILIPEKEQKTKEKNINIDETLTIDYNKYNNLMNNFISIYDVGNIESNLTISMYVEIVGSCENFENNSKNESVMTLTIPLTTNTMAIDIKNDLINTDDNIIICQEKSNIRILFLTLSIILLITDIVFIINLVIYIKKTRSGKTKYELELKRILNNYRQYIEKIDNTLNYSEYQKIVVSTFTDLLEIRDTIREPILMVERQKETNFIIPNNNVLYIYTIKIAEK